MRLNYYRFPEGVDPHVRYTNGATERSGHCTLGYRSSRDCEVCADGCSECGKYHCDDAEEIVYGCTVTFAKKLLRKFGGSAWTEHCERDGGCFEVTPITLDGNNSRFKYNHHL